MSITLKLRTKFAIYGLMSAVMVASMVFVSNWASNSKLIEINNLKLINSVTDRHMEGDMMHDGMKADIYKAIVASYEYKLNQIPDIEKDFYDHYNTFKENLLTNKDSDIPANIKNEITSLLPLLEQYYSTGKTLLDIVKERGDPTLSLNTFNKVFSDLEEKQEVISAAIGIWIEDGSKDIHSVAETAGNLMLLLSGLAILTSLFVPFYAARYVFRPLNMHIDCMQKLANNNTDISVYGVDHHDEIGQIAKSINVFKDNAIEKRELELQQKEQEVRAEQEKKQAMEDLANSFESRVHGIINAVAAAATELSHTAESMTNLTGQASQSVSEAASGSTETTTNIQSVAAAAEEMSASVKEISSQIRRSNELVRDSVNKVEATDTHTKALSDATVKIHEVLQLISDIANEINLLALNATIESARAGEAGKGFAVVANEVKNLANQTDKSIHEIEAVIKEMQNASNNIISSLSGIKESVNMISESSNTITVASDQQSTATNEIASNMQNAASHTTEVTHKLQQVNQSSQSVNDSSQQVYTAAKELSVQSEYLTKEVAEFLSELRTG